ncbi:MAG: diguanylate cyclase [Candidatus Acidiferrales bacterium]
MSSENETTTSPNATAQNHSDASNSSSDSGSSGSSVSSGGSGAAGVSGHAGAPSPTGVLSSSGASSLAADHAHAQARAAETSRAPFPVLVVDDSPVARKLVECSLPKSEYAILLAKTGQEAIEKFAEHRPGLIITDWLMPDFSGIELCERIRREFRNHFTYIIVLTGVQEKTAVVRGLKAGADEYLTKPFDPDELLARAGVGRRIIQMHREIEEKNRLLEQLALTDQLTDLPNRRAVEEWAKRQISAAARHEFPFWVIMTDLDKFKTINDTWGHDAGDTVLRKFAEILKSNTRSSDICGRIGGDEFLMIITHSQPEGIQLAIERMRAQVEAQRFEFNGQEVTLTASFGVASFRRGQVPDLERLIVQADVALYSAKRRGRNCVAIPTTEVR